MNRAASGALSGSYEASSPSSKMNGVEKAYAEDKVLREREREWLAHRGKAPPPPPLAPDVVDLIKEWFSLVDKDSSGDLDINELENALKAAQIPCSSASIHEMLNLMSSNGKEVLWQEFYRFVSGAVYSGQDVLGGELVLPSGLTLPIGQMIAKMRRIVVMTELMTGGVDREEGVSRARRFVESMKSMGARTGQTLESSLTLEPGSNPSSTLEDEDDFLKPVRTHSMSSMFHSLRRPKSAQRSRISLAGKQGPPPIDVTLASQGVRDSKEESSSPFASYGDNASAAFNDLSFHLPAPEKNASPSNLRGSLFKLSLQSREGGGHPFSCPSSPLPHLSMNLRANATATAQPTSPSNRSQSRQGDQDGLVSDTSCSNLHLSLEPASLHPSLSGKQGWGKKLGFTDLTTGSATGLTRSKSQAVELPSISPSNPTMSSLQQSASLTPERSLPLETASSAPCSPKLQSKIMSNRQMQDGNLDLLLDPSYVKSLFSSPRTPLSVTAPTPQSLSMAASRFSSIKESSIASTQAHHRSALKHTHGTSTIELGSGLSPKHHTLSFARGLGDE